MTGKRKPAKRGANNDVPTTAKLDQNKALAVGRTFLRPEVQGAVAIQAYGRGLDNLDLEALISSLTELNDASADGDLKRAEAMLTTQAHTLDVTFNNLARYAINAKRMDHVERYMKLALRAQSQSRATWEALATIKNPPMMGYVRQANIAHGPQQVNNASAAPSDLARAGEKSNQQSKLLEEQDGKRLDTGAAGTPSRVDSEMATVGEIDRTEDRGR